MVPTDDTVEFRHGVAGDRRVMLLHMVSPSGTAVKGVKWCASVNFVVDAA